MDIKRRKFLKLAGLSAVAGIGAPSAFNMLLRGEARASEKGHGEGETTQATEQRLGLVINVRKFAANHGLAGKCINACHTIHNVPNYGNKKDEIKWIWVETFEHAFPEHSQYKRNEGLDQLPIMTLCNHCDNPPCVRACPTQATFKNKKNGVVMMDYHRCIGCRFCMVACPSRARSFNWRSPREKDSEGRYRFIEHLNPDYPTRMRGVVEKCTLCIERIERGQIPACVEATGNTGAMVFGDLHDPNSEISKVLNENFTIQRKPAAGTHPSLFYII